MNENSGTNMIKSDAELKFKNLPTLNEVLLVEKTLQNIKGKTIITSELKKILNNKIAENKLIIILDYLKTKNNIIITPKGIKWISYKQKLLRSYDKILEKSELTEEDALMLGRKVSKKVARRFESV